MSRWDALLTVQEHDTAVDQLVHRRAHLPARSELEELMSSVARTDAAIVEVEARRHELARGQQRLEDEIATLTAKAAASDKTLYGGTIGNPRELQALQEEIAALKRRISQLEDQEIELMEQIEPIDAELGASRATRADLDEKAGTLRAQIAEEEVVIDAELERVRAERTSVAGSVDADLLAEYERLRPHSGGIAIARLVGGSCGGCHLGLSAVEVDRIKKLPPEAPAFCEECGRLLAR
jgi:predicted  nucleic acid-binding Zn-ribbon protein